MSEALVQARGLCKRYRSGEVLIGAITNISLVIEKNDFLAIVGRSGSGKSTLLHLLGLLDRPDSGQLLFAGRHVEHLGEEARAAIRNQKIGFVFQLPALLPRATAVENVALPLVYAGAGRRERAILAENALAAVGLTHRISHYPQQLSGGEQQRVAIARAIITRPALILADEPTGALDSATGDGILSLFERLNEDGRAIVMVTHDSDVAKRARRRVTLHDGAIVDDVAKPPRHFNSLSLAGSAVS